MDRYEVAQEITNTVLKSDQPLEDLKYFARTIDKIWDMKVTEEEIEVKKIILKVKTDGKY